MNDATQRLLSARVRPTRRPVMRQRWDDLFFLHWEYAAEAIQARLPAGLTVDTFEGKAHLGVVGFRMNAVRPIGLPALPWLSYFNELNVRTYVRDATGEPGVWFFSLDCDRAPAVVIARAGFGLPYEHAAMDFGPGLAQSCRRSGETDTAQYAWAPTSTPQVAIPGTLEFHLAERYSFFSERGGRLVRGQVYHTPYELSQASTSKWSDLPLRWDGFAVGGRAPDLAHCCQGVAIEAFSLVPAHA
ncbi:MAG: hypothetical protein CK541_07070 [Opitutia bacterium]|nr:MAG: hypothetical protein CK541_07070 [Opitutae bacterium]